MFKVFSIFSTGGHSVHRSKTICAILLEGIMRNAFFKTIWARGSDVVLNYGGHFV